MKQLIIGRSYDGISLSVLDETCEPDERTYVFINQEDDVAQELKDFLELHYNIPVTIEDEY